MKIHYLFLVLLFFGLFSKAGKTLAIIREELTQMSTNEVTQQQLFMANGTLWGFKEYFE